MAACMTFEGRDALLRLMKSDNALSRARKEMLATGQIKAALTATTQPASRHRFVTWFNNN